MSSPLPSRTSTPPPLSGSFAPARRTARRALAIRSPARALGRAAARAAVRTAFGLAALAFTGAAQAFGDGTLRIGVDARIAAAPLHVAASRGYFEREGLDVELVGTEGIDVPEALVEEELDLATANANALLDAEDGGLELRGAYVLGLSGAADALVALDEVRDTRRLRGRRVAFLPGSAGEVVLRRSLQRKGRRLNDIVPVALGGRNAVRALLAGDVDAATVHGPLLAALLRGDIAERPAADTAAQTDPSAAVDADVDPDAVETPLRVLATADDPLGLVSDLLVGTEDALARGKEETKDVIRALDRAVGWMRRHPDESVALLADVYAAAPEDVARALAGTTLLGVDENMTLLRGEFQKAFSNMSEVLAAAGDERAREVPSANRYLSLSALRQVAAGR